MYKFGYPLIFSFFQIIAISQPVKLLHLLINYPSTLLAILVLFEQLPGNLVERIDLPLIFSSSSMIVSEAFLHKYGLIEYNPTRQILLPSICKPPNTLVCHLQYPYNWKTSPPH